MKSSIIAFFVALAVFAAIFWAFWFAFGMYYFNDDDRNIMLGIMLAFIGAAFLLAYTISNMHKVFSWKEFKRSKTSTELKLIACECMAEAGMLEQEIALQLEDRMKTIQENHNLELIKMKLKTSKGE